MSNYVGFDIGLEYTAVCIMDQEGEILREPDLFTPQKPPAPIPASERMKLLALVSVLLTETAAVAGVEADDEDHA